MDKRRGGGMVMRKILFCLLMISLLVTIPVLAACTDGTTTPTTTTPTTTTPTTTTTTTEPVETLGEILERSAGISSVKYDKVITSPGKETQTIKVWVKGNKMREETTTQGQTVITLLDMDWDARTMYVYNPEQRKDLAWSVTYVPAKSAMDEAQSIPDYAPTIIGHETLDGEVCLVVKYTVVEYTVAVTSKMWIWEQYGFPLRIETTTAEGKTIIEYKNVEFGDIPDSTFELPEGVKIVDWMIYWAYPE
jgi:outer membrane lipoprotein-sorting protein